MTKVNLIGKHKKCITQRMNELKEMQASLNVQERKEEHANLLKSEASLQKLNSKPGMPILFMEPSFLSKVKNLINLKWMLGPTEDYFLLAPIFTVICKNLQNVNSLLL
jgi:hypothetical protein